MKRMSVELNAELSRQLPAGGGQTTLVATIVPNDKQRPTRRHIVVVVDVSGSMSNDITVVDEAPAKIELARQGVANLLDDLNDDDRVSIVAFDSRPDVLLPMTEWGDADHKRVTNMITGTAGHEYDGELVATGGTNILQALRSAEDQFDRDSDGVVSKDVVLLSDGQDRRDLDEFRELAGRLDSKGICISAGGIGSSYNEDVLLSLTGETGGMADHLEDPTDITSFLRERAQDARDTVAPDPQLRLEFADGFMIDPGEPAYVTEPQVTTENVQANGGEAVVDLPKLTSGRRIRLSVKVLGGHKSTGLVYPMADLYIEDSGVLASTSVEVGYEDEPAKETRIEKERLAGDVTADILDPDVEKAAVTSRINDIEQNRGWKQLADVLRKRLAEAEQTSGNISVAKERYRPED